MLHIGIIGLGSTWEQRYRPTLWRLRDRIQVAGVYDPVAAKATQVAAELRTAPVEGIWELLSRPLVKGVLVLDATWLGHIPLLMACSRGKPAYIAGTLGNSLSVVNQLQHESDETGNDLMPELSRRYTPATIRLRELLATRLGRPRRIRVELHLPAVPDSQLPIGQATELDALVGLVDWCRCIVGTTFAGAVSRETVTTGGIHGPARIHDLKVTFKRSATDGEPAWAEIRLFLHQNERCDLPVCLSGHIDCAHGHASLSGPSQLSWKIGAETITESLSSERSELEVMLDHFSRRVVGGLIPVPSVADVSRAMQLIHSASPESNLCKML